MNPEEDIMLNSSNKYVASNCSIDEFRNQVYSTAYSMFTLFGLIGNSFALFVLLKTYSQRTTFHIYMLNLAISDLLFIFTLPFRVIYYVSKGRWFFGDIMCRICSYVFYVNLYCSIFILTAMSFTRFLAIVFPVKNLKLVSVKKAKWACGGIWIFVTLTSSPFLSTGSYFDQDDNKMKCFEPPKNRTARHVFALNYISLVIGFIIPFTIILVCYSMIIRTLMKNSMKKKQSSRKKAIRMIIIVMAVFCMSFMPYHLQRSIHLLSIKDNKSCEETLSAQKRVVITLALAASNCCFDPLLYFFSGENFRRRLSTFRKQSVTSMAHDFKRKKSGSLQDKSAVFCELEKNDSNESEDGTA